MISRDQNLVDIIARMAIYAEELAGEDATAPFGQASDDNLRVVITIADWPMIPARGDSNPAARYGVADGE